MSTKYNTTPEEIARRTERFLESAAKLTAEEKSQRARKGAKTREANRKEKDKRLEELEIILAGMSRKPNS